MGKYGVIDVAFDLGTDRQTSFRGLADKFTKASVSTQQLVPDQTVVPGASTFASGPVT